MGITWRERLRGKRLTVGQTQYGCASIPITATFAYDNEGKLLSTTYPSNYSTIPAGGISVTNTLNAMSQIALVSVVESDASGSNVQCHPATPKWGTNNSGTLMWAQNASYSAAGRLTNLSLLGSVAVSGGNSPCVLAP